MSALFGPSSKHHVVQGGFCISVFAIIKKADSILVVKPKPHQKWKEWAPNWQLYEEERLETEFSKWRFPSSYVNEGEHPDDTLARILRGQLGIKDYEVKAWRLVNFYTPSRRYPGKMHWDYCFLYDVKTEQTPSKKPWLEKLEFVARSELKEDDFGSAQGSLLEYL